MAESAQKIKRDRRFEVWERYCKKMNPAVVADELGLKFKYVNNLYERWRGTERMDRLKEKRVIYTKPPEEEIVKSDLFKLSERLTESNPFVLITTNAEVWRAYRNMLNNRNTDIPM